jgi:hypothetical protein
MPLLTSKLNVILFLFLGIWLVSVVMQIVSLRTLINNHAITSEGVSYDFSKNTILRSTASNYTSNRNGRVLLPELKQVDAVKVTEDVIKEQKVLNKYIRPLLRNADTTTRIQSAISSSTLNITTNIHSPNTSSITVDDTTFVADDTNNSWNKTDFTHDISFSGYKGKTVMTAGQHMENQIKHLPCVYGTLLY